MHEALGAHQTAEVVEFFRNVLLLLSELIGTFTDVPEKYFTLTLIFQGDQSQIEHLEKVFSMLQSVVIVLSIVLGIDGFAKIVELSYHLWVVSPHIERRNIFYDRLDLVLNVRHEDRVICR